MPVLPKCCSALVVAAALCFLQEMHSARSRRPPTNETLTQAPPKLPRAQARGIDRDTRYCPGYYDLLGQWENAFVCNSSQYMYCCGTCSQRYCCQNRKQLLRQNACSNHHSQNGTIKLAVPKKESLGEEYDPASDKTHVIVYVVCGLIAFLLLLGVLAKMGLDKAARVARDIHMPKTLSEILHYQTHGSEDEELKSHSLHSLPLSREESMSRSYKKHGDKGRFNNIHVTSALMTPLGPSQSHPHLAYLPAICKPEYNHFASLKRLADKEMSEYYTKRHLAELAASSTLPLNVPTALPHSPEHHYYGPYGSAAMLVELRGPPTAMALASATASSCCPCEAPVGDGQSSELDSYLAEKHRCELFGHEDARAAYHTWRGSSDRNVHYPGEIFNSTPTLSRNERRCASQRQAPTEDSMGYHKKVSHRSTRPLPPPPPLKQELQQQNKLSRGARRSSCTSGGGRPHLDRMKQQLDNYGSTTALDRKRESSGRSSHRPPSRHSDQQTGESSEDYDAGATGQMATSPHHTYYFHHSLEDESEGGRGFTPFESARRHTTHRSYSATQRARLPSGVWTPDRLDTHSIRRTSHEGSGSTPTLARGVRLNRMQSVIEGSSKRDAFQTWTLASSSKRDAFAGRQNLTLEQLNEQPQPQVTYTLGRSRNEVTV